MTQLSISEYGPQHDDTNRNTLVLLVVSELSTVDRVWDFLSGPDAMESIFRFSDINTRIRMMQWIVVLITSFTQSQWPRTWVPIASAIELNPQKPNAIKTLGREYVCWHSEQDGWRVFDDRCPHRLAPLSEGRIEQGRLQCGYHGWEFEGCGKCTRIPQMSSPSIPRRCNSNSYPVQTCNSIIWMWPWDDATTMDSVPSPEEIMRPFCVTDTYTRDFPYD